MNIPPVPHSAAEIYDYPGKGEYLACAIVHRDDARQLMAFRKLRHKLGEVCFREALVEAIDIIAHSRTIVNPSGWLYSFIAQEVDHD